MSAHPHRRLPAAVLALALAACNHPRSADPATEGAMVAPLSLLATPSTATYPAGGPIQITVTLTNAGPASRWVNRRMAPGYEDGLLRELYFTVRDAATGAVRPVPASARVDAHLMPPERKDFVELAAAASVSVTLDVARWYPFEPGRYQVGFTYVNDDAGGEFGLAAFTGSVTAPDIELTVTAK